jgi:hypothetical protein
VDPPHRRCPFPGTRLHESPLAQLQWAALISATRHLDGVCPRWPAPHARLAIGPYNPGAPRTARQHTACVWTVFKPTCTCSALTTATPVYSRQVRLTSLALAALFRLWTSPSTSVTATPSLPRSPTRRGSPQTCWLCYSPPVTTARALSVTSACSWKQQCLRAQRRCLLASARCPLSQQASCTELSLPS